jgi:hypothetical protein
LHRERACLAVVWSSGLVRDPGLGVKCGRERGRRVYTCINHPGYLYPTHTTSSYTDFRFPGPLSPLPITSKFSGGLNTRLGFPQRFRGNLGKRFTCHVFQKRGDIAPQVSRSGTVSFVYSQFPSQIPFPLNIGTKISTAHVSEGGVF